jgi:integrase
MFKTGHIPAHKGKVITTDPIKTGEKVAQIKALLVNDVRGLALWTLATHSMLRSGDLVNLKWEDLHEGEDGGCEIRLHEQKTGKLRVIALPKAVCQVLFRWRAQCDHSYIYSGERGPLTTATWGRMIKGWCLDAGFKGNFSGHTARKTGVRVRYDEHGVKLATLMHMLNHGSEATTLIYMGRMQEEVKQAYSVTL